MASSIMLAPLLASSLLGSPLHTAVRPALLSAAWRTRSCIPARMSAEPVASPLDLVGDGGVLKTIEAEGSGGMPSRGAKVEVHYEGRLVATGERFDSSRARGKTFSFTLGVRRHFSRSRVACVLSCTQH